MPFGNRTGPRGEGPMTGRGMGYCAGYPQPGYTHPYRGGFGRGWGRGLGRGFGRGFGRGWGYPAYPYRMSVSEEKEVLKNEKEALKSELDSLKKEMETIEDRIKELKKK